MACCEAQQLLADPLKPSLLQAWRSGLCPVSHCTDVGHFVGTAFSLPGRLAATLLLIGSTDWHHRAMSPYAAGACLLERAGGLVCLCPFDFVGIGIVMEMAR